MQTSAPLTLGKKLIMFREAKKWTQPQAAERIGVSPGALANYEMDHRGPSVAILERLAAAYGVTVRELYDPRWDEVLELKARAVAKVEEILAEGLSNRIYDDPELVLDLVAAGPYESVKALTNLGFPRSSASNENHSLAHAR
jgi:transcriptional regulator with XRE-family HTH domain